METRTFNAVFSSEARKLVGYATVFDTPTTIRQNGRSFSEVIRPGAFARALASGGDIISTFNHNSDNLLGRTASGTLRLAEDSHGLRFELDLPDTTLGNDLRTLVGRGDLRGASFAFSVRKNGEKWLPAQNGMPVRELTDLYLSELGPVVMPAYPTTSVGLRSATAEIMRMRLLLAEKS